MSVPAVPHLDTFQQQGLILGAKWARYQDQYPTFGFGVESQVWFYDGGRVYLQLADALGDTWDELGKLQKPQTPPLHPPSWYAQNIFDQYESYILNQPTPPGVGPGYRLFPYGVNMQGWRTGADKHNQCLDYMIANTAYIRSKLCYLREHNEPKGAKWAPWCIREASYTGDILLAQLARDGIKNALLEDCIFDCIIADLNEFMRPGSTVYLGTNDPARGTYINNFMIGLALETLINYFELTHDERIPPVIRATLGFFWINCVEKLDPFTGKESYAQYYNSDLVNGLPKNPTMMPDGVTPVRYTTSSLNQLVSPAYAWYWLYSGDDVYLDQGDKLWTAGVMGAGRNCPASITCQDYTYMGKQYSQNYKWAYDFLQWRKKPESCKAQQNNKAETAPPAQDDGPVLVGEPGQCLCYWAIENFDGESHDPRCELSPDYVPEEEPVEPEGED